MPNTILGDAANSAWAPGVGAYTPGGATPYDGQISSGQVGNRGFGSTGGLQDVINFFAGIGTPMQGGTVPGSGKQPYTYSIANPNQFGFGFGQGVPGGSVLDFLRSSGFPNTQLPEQLSMGRPVGPTDYGRAFQTYGGMGVPSPQTLTNLGPSGAQYLLGLITTLLGIGDQDTLWAALQPFTGLMGAHAGRTPGLGGMLR